MNKKYLTILATIGVIALSFTAYYTRDNSVTKSVLGAFGDPFLSIQLATSPSNGNCLTTDGTNNVWSSSCGAGGSGGGTWSTTTSSVAGQNINYPNETDDIVVIGSNATTSAEVYFDPNTQKYQIGNAMTASTTVLGLLNIAYSSSTVYSSFLTASTTDAYFGTGQGIAYVGSNGRLRTTATSTFSLSQFTNDLANLTATDSTLTFSGNYNGSVARTIGLNLGNANTWTAKQNFFASASSTLLSANWLKVGGTASTTIGVDGNVTIEPLTASRAVFTDSNKVLTTTGTVGALESSVGSQNILLETEIDACSELAALLDAETGGCNGTSGPVFPDAPVFSGIVNMTGRLGIGTTTPWYQLTIASTTGPQFALSEGAGIPQWTFRNAGGSFYISSTTVAGTATTSTAAFSILSTGETIIRNILQIISVAETKLMDVSADTVTLLGTWNFSGATVKEHTYSSFSYATSTAWTATTTIPLGPAYTAESWTGVKCFTDTGTLNVSFNDGTNRMDMLNASTTVGSFLFSTNNTFTASEKRYVDVGTPASSPTKISCTVDKIVNN